jgi:hypothetical protein
MGDECPRLLLPSVLYDLALLSDDEAQQLLLEEKELPTPLGVKGSRKRPGGAEARLEG